MSAPINNLDELRRKQANSSTPIQSPTKSSASSGKFSKFKPSKSLQTPENVTVRKPQAALPAFRTPGFGKDTSTSSNSSLAAEPGVSIPVLEISSDEEFSIKRLPVKRLSTDAAYDAESSSPSKRAKVDAYAEKENFLSDAGGKGKGRARPDELLRPPETDVPLSPRSRVVNMQDQQPSLGLPLPRFSTPPPAVGSSPGEWTDLISKSADELSNMLNANLELLTSVSEKVTRYNSGDDRNCDCTCLLEISKLLTRRNKAIMAAKGAIEGRPPPSQAHSRSLATAHTSSSASQEHTNSSLCVADSHPLAQPCAGPSPASASTSAAGFTTVKRTVVGSSSSAPTFNPASDDMWHSVEDITVDDKNDDVGIMAGPISRSTAEPFSSSSTVSNAPASSSTTSSSSTALSRRIVELAASHSMVGQIPLALTRTKFYPEVKRKLRQVFGLTHFRTNQLEAISATLAGEDTIVLMPTGGGKSLCYQLPAVCDTGATRGLTVVICPLLSLMMNQVEALEKRGVDVVCYNSGQTSEESDTVTRRLRERGKRPKILYFTPEKLRHSVLLVKTLNEARDAGELARFVVDEGHVVVKWGRDFREAYRFLDCIRTDFPGIPIMALTATATQAVKNDLIRILKIRGCREFWQSMNRPNLNYEVRPRKSVEREIVQFIRERYPNETGIIYARSRGSCETLAMKLREAHGLQARHFHAKMAQEDKKEALEQWQSGRCKIIVATIAFGMGIDKPDVRYVIHHDLPNDLDGYYQETGRAGRDGKHADCILFYSFVDVNTRRRQIRDNREIGDKEREHQEQEILRVAQFCQNNVDCRRTQVLAYYDETFNPAHCNNGCDNCRDASGIEEEDVTDMAVKIIRFTETLIDSGNVSITRNQLLDVFWGKSSSALRHWQSHELFGSGKDMPRDRTERIVDHLDNLNIFRSISKQNGEWSAAYIEVTPRAGEFIQKGERLVMRFRATPAKAATGTSKRRKRPSYADNPPAAGRSRQPSRRQVDPEPEEGVTMDLYRDDMFDFGSPHKPATRAKMRVTASAINVDVDEIEDADKVADAGQDPTYALFDALKDARAQVADEEGIADMDRIIPDQDLFLLATVRPTDENALNDAVADVETSDFFRHYAGRFLARCIQHPQSRSAQPKKPQVASITNLHERYTYQNASKPGSSSRSRPS